MCAARADEAASAVAAAGRPEKETTAVGSQARNRIRFL